MSFDAWETGIHSNGDYLMHWGIRGMKHGRRRYQNEDGTWTEAGLEARRKREGFGEERAAKKVAKAERRQARKAARSEARAAMLEKRRANNPKYMSDEDLQKRIDRLKLETEYRELKRSPLIKQGMNLVNKYLEYKANKDEKAERRYNMQTNRINAQANLKRAKAEKQRAIADEKRAIADAKRAKSDIIDNLTFGKGRKDAKTKLIEAKEKAKSNTVLGIIKGNWKKASEADTNNSLYKRNEYFRKETDERRLADRAKSRNEYAKSLASIEIGKGNQETGKGMQEKAITDRKKKDNKKDDDKKKKKS